MSFSKSYILPIKGLSDGMHDFSFELNSDFFKRFEESRIKNGQFVFEVELVKKSTMLVFSFDFKAKMKTSCDRCAADIQLDLVDDFRLIVKTLEGESADADVVYIDPETSEFDLSPYLYEYAHLALPIRMERDCENEDYKYCDHEALDKLEQTREDDDKGEEETTNKLWQELKNIKLDN